MLRRGPTLVSEPVFFFLCVLMMKLSRDRREILGSMNVLLKSNSSKCQDATVPCNCRKSVRMQLFHAIAESFSVPCNFEIVELSTRQF